MVNNGIFVVFVYQTSNVYVYYSFIVIVSFVLFQTIFAVYTKWLAQNQMKTTFWVTEKQICCARCVTSKWCLFVSST